jgi:hypothetical protein
MKMTMTFNEAKSHAQQMAKSFHALSKLEEVLLVATQANQTKVQVEAEVQVLRTRLAEDKVIHAQMLEEQAGQLAAAKAETQAAVTKLAHARTALAEARSVGKAEADRDIEAERERAQAMIKNIQIAVREEEGQLKLIQGNIKNAQESYNEMLVKLGVKVNG